MGRYQGTCSEANYSATRKGLLQERERVEVRESSSSPTEERFFLMRSEKCHWICKYFFYGFYRIGKLARIGGHKVIPVDVRIIAATNKNLREEVQKGNFRQDLYFRLNVLPIKIPSLSERGEDAKLLASHFVDIYSKKIPRKIEAIHPLYMEAIKKYNWPGNVRELQNVIERSLNRCTAGVLSLDTLPEEVVAHYEPGQSQYKFNSSKDMIQKQMLVQVLLDCNYNYSKAAKKLNISRSTLYRWMERFNLQ